MAVRRTVEQVAGSPEKVASRAAARLAYLGETVEPLSPTSLEWRPQRAERVLFRSPGWIRVTCVPSEQPGHTTVVTEWDPRTTSGRFVWPLVGVLGAVGLLTLLALPAGWPLWKAVFVVWPALFGAVVGPHVMSGGAVSRLTKLCATGTSAVFDEVPEALEYLTLTDERRAIVLTELADRATRIRSEQSGFRKMPFAGEDRRSTVEILGWPLWHVATGRDPVTEMTRVARGWYARGQLAQGLLAVGQRAHGWCAVGQLAYGLLALGQAGVGLVAGLGQFGLGGLFGAGQFGIGLVAAGMAGLGAILAAIPPMGDAFGAVVALSALVLTLAAWLAVWIGAKLCLGRVQAKEIERQLEVHRLSERAFADDASLSAAERMSAPSAERGLSPAELDAETER